ncbi:phosphoesterase [Bacillus sp. UMB0899]|uniref:IDEAL domain-containing protein n=1 Tax=Metabacillus schmidteae TaxID=2730405 RepID=UPI000C7FA07A|nr:IDEAL domain-containing protein [Metabacillus schmidteae]PMC40215.1 phosphoesterase [Bacillus sp. UMB0899]
MKKDSFDSTQPELKVIDTLVAEMVIDNAIQHFRKEKIQQKIDQSLRDKNKMEFLRLTEKLKDIS